MNANFIKTPSMLIYDRLLKSGATYIGQEGELYCFINDIKNFTFSDEDKKEILFTNIICLQES